MKAIKRSTAVALLGILHLGAWVMLFQFARQQGRVLLRLEKVEDDLGSARRRTSIPIQSVNGTRDQSGVLPVGAVVPSFRIPDLTGSPVGLEDYRGKRVLLVHWSFECGFCVEIADDLARLQSQLHDHDVELVLVSYGEAEDNRRHAEEYGLSCTILLQQEGERAAVFRHMGTPVAYLLDDQLHVTKPGAIGADEVSRLASAAAENPKRLPGERPLSESRIERDGLKRGTPAPLFSLPDLRGDVLSLADYRGGRVILVFTDPQCGPCKALLPELVEIYQERHDDRCGLIMISRGPIDADRQTANEFGVNFPIVIQPHWKLSKAYGIFATPVAFLVDGDGVIAEDVARGPDHILRLARAELIPKEKVGATHVSRPRKLGEP